MQVTCLQLYRFREGKDIMLQVHSSDCLPCDIKGKREEATAILKEFSQYCMKTRYI